MRSCLSLFFLAASLICVSAAAATSIPLTPQATTSAHSTSTTKKPSTTSGGSTASSIALTSTTKTTATRPTFSVRVTPGSPVHGGDLLVLDLEADTETFSLVAGNSTDGPNPSIVGIFTLNLYGVPKLCNPPPGSSGVGPHWLFTPPSSLSGLSRGLIDLQFPDNSYIPNSAYMQLEKGGKGPSGTTGYLQPTIKDYSDGSGAWFLCDQFEDGPHLYSSAALGIGRTLQGCARTRTSPN